MAETFDGIFASLLILKCVLIQPPVNKNKDKDGINHFEGMLSNVQ